MKTGRAAHTIAAALLASGAFAAIPAGPAEAGTVLGGLPHLDRYCRSIGYRTVVLEEPTAYGWKCDSATVNSTGIDMTAACRWTYREPHAVAAFRNAADPYSWYCYLP